MQPATIGRYRISHRLGGGAMGQVYLATDTVLGRSVAVKIMRPHTEEGPERFAQEARTVAALSHPNIVVLHDFGLEGDQPFLVMEHLEGASLDEWQRVSRSLPERLVVLRGLCRATKYAHGRGVLHRDIKPSNVQVLPDGECKLMDFGIARTGTTRMTATGIVLGTPEYVAPELLAGAPASAASDDYALAVLAYELFTGANPFAAETLVACLRRVAEASPTDLAVLRPDLPAGLAKAVMAYLAKEPAERPRGIEPLLIAVEEALAETLRGPPPLPAITPTLRLAATTETAGGARRRALWLGGASLFLALIVAVGLWLSHGGDTLAPPPTARPTAGDPSVPAPSTQGASAPAKSGAAMQANPPANDNSPRRPTEPARRLDAANPPETRTQSRPAASGPAEQRGAATGGGATKPPVDTTASTVVARPETGSPEAIAAEPAAALPAPAPEIVTPQSTPPVSLAPAESPGEPGTQLRLLSVTPDSIRRGSSPTLLLRGNGLPAAPRVELRRGRRPAQGVSILSIATAGAGELRVKLLIDDDAPLGATQVVILGADGRASNPVTVEIEL